MSSILAVFTARALFKQSIRSLANKAYERNLSAVLFAKDDLRMMDRPVPTIKPNQVLIRVGTVGICGTDVHYWKHATLGPYTLKKPMTLGHEGSGTVIEVGSEVRGLNIGDRVAMEPGVPCRTCDDCRHGRYNLCENIRFFANPPDDGTMCRYMAHDADYCFKLPDNVTMDEGALMEPLAVAVHGVRRANVTMGDKVLVLGAGPIGLLNMLTAMAMGISKVFITDIVDDRLQLAKKLGANSVLNVKGMKPSEVAQASIEGLGGRPDVVLESNGVQASTEAGVLACKNRGSVVLCGLASERISVPVVEAAIREINILGVFRYTNCWPTAIEIVSSGKVNLKGITTAHYKLEEAPEAFQRFLKGDVIKVMVHCDNNQ